MKKYLVTFADKRLKKSLNRIVKQVNKLNYFNNIFTYTEEDLPEKFRKKYRSKLIPGSRGFGYWCWKPEIIRVALNQIEVGNSLLFIDVGCHINKAGLTRLDEYFKIVDKSSTGILAFQAKTPTPDISPLNYDGRKLFDQPNFRWIKGDLFDYFSAQNSFKFSKAQAIGATVILIKKCKESIEIIDEWRNIISYDFNLIDDSPSKSANFEGFIEHRHDQAIFSLLCLKHQVNTLSAYEYWYPKVSSSEPLKPDWKALKKFPIHAKRDKEFSFIYNCKRFPKRFINKIKRLFVK